MYYENMLRVEIKNFNAITHKEGTNDAFLQPINWAYYDEALSKLSANAFKLWFYLLRWAGKGYYDFSPTNLCKVLKIKSKNTIYAAKDELIENNYLYQISDNKLVFSACGHADSFYQKMVV